MPESAVRRSRLRLFLYTSLFLTIAMALLAGWMLHWNDQLKLYWQEQTVDAAPGGRGDGQSRPAPAAHNIGG
ncbi:MAG TPA: hypothetical protein DCX38_17315, partial [Pseudomonas sp.]|nr:hypothetical protein [Pseudomonas sp.]